MKLFRKHTTAADRVPEEDDDLVGVLRQAFTSTPVPERLIPGIQSAVARSSMDAARSVRFSRPSWRIGAALAPACGAAVAIGLVLGGAFNSASTPTAGVQLSRADVIWSNAPALDLHARAGLRHGKVTVSYSIGKSAEFDLAHGVNTDRGLLPPEAMGRVPHSGLVKVGLQNFLKDVTLNSGSGSGSCHILGRPSPHAQQTCSQLLPETSRSNVTYAKLVMGLVSRKIHFYPLPQYSASPRYVEEGSSRGKMMAPSAETSSAETCPTHAVCWVLRIHSRLAKHVK